MTQDAPSARERQLARELRLLRSTVGLTGKDVAERLGWSTSKVSRIETGRIGIGQDDLESLFGLYEVLDDKAEYLRRLAASARAQGWWDAYANNLSSGYSSLIKLEAGSAALRCYCALVPHALLQTPEYSRHVIQSTLQVPAPTEIDRRIDIARRRQAVLRRENPPMRLSAVIDEGAFRRHIRTPDGRIDNSVTRAQFRRLADLSAWPHITIQVLLFKSGIPPVTSGSFSILESLATNTPDVAYLENKTRFFFIDTETEVHQYVQEFELLSSMALDPDESRAFIERAANR
ncbi:helix-turn-helix transcriptional regulator [Amycolatopsis sp. NPDC049691]|uniref:helix-turn-helix domain-containing protein n=1 Tax=Amycolatopsis sp. NPDC049691 TaxID=3155155 RepID=UPI00341F5BC5